LEKYTKMRIFIIIIVIVIIIIIIIIYFCFISLDSNDRILASRVFSEKGVRTIAAF